MKAFRRALIPIPLNDLKKKASLIEKLLSIAAWIDCDSHLFVHGEPADQDAEESLSKLAEISASCSVSVHRSRGEVISEVRNLIETYNVELLIITTTPDELIALTKTDREILRATEIPALLVPEKMLSRGIPESLLVPVSGEQRGNRALDLGIRISNERNLPLDLLHVTQIDESCNCDSHFLESYGDQFHYEYPTMIDEIVAQASPFSTAAERRCVRVFRHIYGEIGPEIVTFMNTKPEAWLVLDWGGSMDPGRAHIIKRELRRFRYPILLVHSARKRTIRLKVGKNFEAA